MAVDMSNEPLGLYELFQHELTKTQRNLMLYSIHLLDDKRNRSIFKLTDVQSFFPKMKDYTYVKNSMEELSLFFQEENDRQYPKLIDHLVVENGLVQLYWEVGYVDSLMQIEEEVITPHINFLANCDSKYTILLLEYLLYNLGEELNLSVNDLLHILNLQDNQTYTKNSYNFKTYVLTPVFTDLKKHKNLNFHVKAYGKKRFVMSLKEFDQNNNGKEGIVLTSDEFKSIVVDTLGAEESYKEILGRLQVKKTMLLSYVVDIAINDYAPKSIKDAAREVHQSILSNEVSFEKLTMTELNEIEQYFDVQISNLKPHISLE